MKNITSKSHSRAELIFDTLVLQLKLIVDSLRDLLLMPLALMAAVFGLLLHKQNPGRYVYRLLSYGKASEKWIGLFDNADKDTSKSVQLQHNLEELIKKTQCACEEKFINHEQKQKILTKLDSVLDELNAKVNRKKPTP